jgi:hypothetical protein
MYGIISVAILTGIIGIQIIKENNIKDIKGESRNSDKEKDPFRNTGGLFWFGWALVGSCPGPIFILLGAGFGPFL